EPGLVQLVDHEPGDRLGLFGHHPNAVPLAEAAQKVVFGPRVLETRPLRFHHLRHVPADHPPDVNRPRHRPVLLPRTSTAHERTPSPRPGHRVSTTNPAASRRNVATPPCRLNPGRPPRPGKKTKLEIRKKHRPIPSPHRREARIEDTLLS